MIPKGPFYEADADGNLGRPLSLDEVRRLSREGKLSAVSELVTEVDGTWKVEQLLLDRPGNDNGLPVPVVVGAAWIICSLAIISASSNLPWIVLLSWFFVSAVIALAWRDRWWPSVVDLAIEFWAPMKYVLVVVLVGCLLFGGVGLIRQATATEYRIVFVPDYKSERELKLIGEEGWKIISVRRAMDGTTGGYEYHLER